MEDTNSDGIMPSFKTKLENVVSGRYKSRQKTEDYNFMDFYNRTGHDLSTMLVECSYRGTECNQARHWATVYTRYGKCYTFNNPKDKTLIKQTLKGGVDNGLEVLLDLEQNEYMPVWSDSGTKLYSD